MHRIVLFWSLGKDVRTKKHSASAIQAAFRRYKALKAFAALLYSEYKQEETDQLAREKKRFQEGLLMLDADAQQRAQLDKELVKGGGVGAGAATGGAAQK